MTQTQTALTPEQIAIQDLEAHGYRIVKDGSAVIVVSGRGKNVMAIRFDSAEAAVVRLLQPAFGHEATPDAGATEGSIDVHEISESLSRRKLRSL